MKVKLGRRPPVAPAPQAAALRELVAALDELARKYDRHRRCGWDHIKVGALDQVIDAYRTSLETTP